MAKFEEVFEDTQLLFNNLISTADLERVVNIKVLANNSLKEIGKVIKANDLVKHMTSEDVIILLNEKIFEQLTPQQKIIVAEDLLARVKFDFENDKLTIAKPDFQGFSLILDKYTYPIVKVLTESIKSLFTKEKEDADASANATTPKGKKNFQKA